VASLCKLRAIPSLPDRWRFYFGRKNSRSEALKDDPSHADERKRNLPT
jgi:hypothetical protein